MAVLDNIKPERVMYYFEKLCSVPHGSGNTAAATAICRGFARENDLEYIEDELGNCVIKKEAYPGYENAPVVIIQGHLDMVCEKEPDCDIDMSIEGLRLGVSGDEIFAEGTTLGADDGIAVAMALAILEDKTLPHPAIEALFTVDEEIGMVGATAFDTSVLNGRMLINIDSEDEGVFTVSCAGGVVAACTLPVEREAFDGSVYKVSITGLKGGHSGAEIDRGRANADVLMGRVLNAVNKSGDMRIVEVNGGLKDNAIPSSSTAVLVSDFDITEVVQKFNDVFSHEYIVAEDSIKVSSEKITSATYMPMDKNSTKKVITALCTYPNGIQSMSLEIENLVKTSLNLGILKTEKDCVTASFCVRSSVFTEKEALTDRLELITESLGGSMTLEGDYPPWEYMRESKLRDIMTEVFVKMYDKQPIIEAIHAGIECGILSGTMPGLECVSIGPDIMDIHTPSERMSISSVERVWKYLLEVLKSIK